MADVSKALNIVRKLSPSGFFSKATEEAQRLPQAKGTGEQMRAMLLKQGVKPDELKWTGFDDWVKGKKSVTRDEVAEFLRRNEVQVGEKTLGDLKAKIDPNSKYAIPQVMRAARQAGDSPDDLLLTIANDGDAYRALMRRFPELRDNDDWAEVVTRSVFGGDTKPAGVTKFDQYTLPGGENYREMLLTRPRTDKTIPEIEAEMGFTRPLTNEQQDAVIARWKQHTPESADYQSSHFPDTPNPIAHMRMKERVDPEGRRVLHLEEVQSDWAQEGRKKGFRGAAEAQMRGAMNELEQAKMAFQSRYEELTRAGVGDPWADATLRQLEDASTDAARRYGELNRQSRTGLPDAPYVDSTAKWTDLALKRAMIEAARGNFDAIAWTPGRMQADRYKLSNSISELEWSPDTNRLVAYGPNGDAVINRTATPAELQGLVGKEVADRLVATPPTMAGNEMRHTLSGLDLDVGGKGMEGYYDKILPTQVSKVLKDIGETPQFGNVSIPVERQSSKQFIPSGPDLQNAPQSYELPSFNLTPEMRAKINEGLPLFTMMPAAVGLGATASQVVEGQNPAEKPEDFAGGGKIVQRALEAVRGIRAYHVSPKDFEVFKPSEFRGASFFASTPERAHEGAGAGANEMIMETSTVLPPTKMRTYEVEIDPSKIKGLHLTPAEREWVQSMPSKIVGDEALEDAIKGRPNPYLGWDHIYNPNKIGDRLYEYVKKDELPSISYENAIRTGRDLYGRQHSHYGPSADEKAAAERVLREGMGGYLVNDEAGLSIAVADPSIVQILRKYGLPMMATGAGAASIANQPMAQEEQQGFADGGHVEHALRLIQDQYPTHYLPNVGRQVMADGGSPADDAYLDALLEASRPDADIRQYQSRMREIAQQPEDIRSMTHAPSKPMRPIEIEGGFIGKRELGQAPYDVAGPLSGLAQTAYSLKTAPLYFTPAMPLAAASDIGEAAIDTKKALDKGDYLSAGLSGVLGVGAGAFPFRRQIGDAASRAVSAARDVLGRVPAPVAAGAAGAAAMTPEDAEAVVPKEIAKRLLTKFSLPKSEVFEAAVRNTPSARLSDEGLIMSLVRGQRPEQAGQLSTRGGVFYLPEGSKDARYYRGGVGTYFGGPSLISGKTLISNPLFVKGATGGKAPEAAYDALLGKGAYQNMRTEALSSLPPYYFKEPDLRVELVNRFLEKYAPSMAGNEDYILRSSAKANQLPFALQEAAVADAARNAGHDAVLGYSVSRKTKEPFLSELFDLRERSYPTPEGRYEIWPRFLSEHAYGGEVEDRAIMLAKEIGSSPRETTTP